MGNKKGKILELVTCLIVLVVIIMLAVLGKLPKQKEVEILPETTPIIMERVQ